MKIYTYKGCDSCRKALRWLDNKNISYDNIPIRETPPSEKELKTMLKHYEGNLKKIFNTSGQDYRNLGIKDKLPNMDDSEAIKLLASNGNLIKRPFLLTKDSGIVGFKEDAWQELL